jgi:hypothetical protein
MRFKRFVMLIFLPLSVSAWGQQTQRSTAPPAGLQGPLSQALAIAGGVPAITAITDYTATGNLIYHGSQNVQGTVTLSGKGLDQFRMDTSLSTGVRSHVVNNGMATTKDENGTVSSFPRNLPAPGQAPRPIPSSDAFPYERPMFPGALASPFQQLAAALNNPAFRIAYKGILSVNGHSAHDFQVQRVLSGSIDLMSEYHTRDFFVDVSTLQVVMTLDMVPKNVVREILYSDYQAVNGVLMPFSITEVFGGQTVWAIQLIQFSFNVGLQNSVFVLE